jgi:hypothetical protein
VSLTNERCRKKDKAVLCLAIKGAAKTLPSCTEKIGKKKHKMGSPISVYFSSLNHLVILIYYYLSNSSNLVLSVDAIESPQYTVVHSEPDLEIRLYVESSWISALARGATSFEKSTKYGFHRFTHQLIHTAAKSSLSRVINILLSSSLYCLHFALTRTYFLHQVVSVHSWW